MSDLFVGLGLMLVFEGAIYALAPSTIRKLGLDIQDMPDQRLRNFGLIAAFIGVGIVWMVRG